MTTPLRALIFDVDGTLAETEDAHRQAFNQAFAEHELDWRWDQNLYRELLKTAGGKERIAAFAPASDADLIKRLHARKTEIYTAAIASGAVPLRPGIARLITQARAEGVILAVATTTTRDNVTALFAGTGLDARHFHTIACADDAPIKKPDPHVYNLVLDRLGLPPAACLAVEDSANGIRAACAAGLGVVAVRSVYTAGDDPAGALIVYDDLAKIGLKTLRRLHGDAIFGS